MLALAHVLQRPCTEKHLQPHAWELLAHLGQGATLAGIDLARSDPLEAPWPELVVSAERCAEPVALWIQRQSAGKTRLLHLGRPWAAPEHWDQIVTTPRYSLPRRGNILRLSLPPAALVGEADDGDLPDLSSDLGHLPRPWIALLVGNSGGSAYFSTARGAVLGDLADRLAAATGGTLLYCDSHDTPWATGDAIIRQLRGDNYICHSEEDGGPYRALLACADGAIIAGDSPAFMDTAVATGKPLWLFDIEDDSTPWWQQAHNYRPAQLASRLGEACCPPMLRTQSGALRRGLIASGRALPCTKASLPAMAQRFLVSGNVAKDDSAERERIALVAAVERLLPARN